jgi:hypothetical protein
MALAVITVKFSKLQSVNSAVIYPPIKSERS